MSLKSLVARAFFDTPLYDPVRNAYQFLFNKDYLKCRRDRLNFYRQFIRPGSLVFDVGANVGEYTRTFLRLGATVVAVEPNPACLEKLGCVRPKHRVRIERVVVGERSGTATLRVGRNSELGTVSEEWIGIASQLERCASHDWKNRIDVRMTTLDELVQKHGIPQFLKVDVEGYEKQALSGLSSLPSYVSFEFITELIPAVVGCFALPVFRDEIECNIVVGEPREFLLNRWVTPGEIQLHLLRISGPTYGDIVVRRKGSL